MAEPPSRRGEIWWVDFEPSIGGEIRKVRPAIIVSNDVANRVMNRIQVVPLTSLVSRAGPAEALVATAQGPRRCMADQVTTLSKRRLRDRIGAVLASDVDAVEHAIGVRLALR